MLFLLFPSFWKLTDESSVHSWFWRCKHPVIDHDEDSLIEHLDGWTRCVCFCFRLKVASKKTNNEKQMASHPIWVNKITKITSPRPFVSPHLLLCCTESKLILQKTRREKKQQWSGDCGVGGFLIVCQWHTHTHTASCDWLNCPMNEKCKLWCVFTCSWPIPSSICYSHEEKSSKCHVKNKCWYCQYKKD